MLPRPNRLPSPHIRAVLRLGRRVTAGAVQLVYTRSTLDHSRFAVVVSTKVDKHATVRNRLKRLIRESLRRNFSAVPSPLDGVVFIRWSQQSAISAHIEMWVRHVLASAT